MEENMIRNIYIYLGIYNWVPLMYTWNLHNSVNQLYFNKK